MKDLGVIVPVYNEEGAIAGVLEKWIAALDELNISYAIHAYNDGSKDASLKILNEYAASAGGKIIVHDKSNSGHGPTILSGYVQNCDCCEWLFQIDSDDEMGPECFKELWSRRSDYDFLLGTRDGRVQPLPRKIISAISRFTVRCFYGKGVSDVNSPYRLMRASCFKELYHRIPQDTFAPNVIVSGHAGRKKLRCFELPVPHGGRKTGEVSIKKWKLLKASLRSFMQTISFAFEKSP